MLILPFFHKITIAPIQLTIGIMIFILGVIGTIVSYNNYFTTDENKLITKGLYRVSRNPIYVSTIIMVIGMSVVCTIYEMIPVIIIYFLVQHPIIKAEEHFCKETYGEDFEIYKKNVRRYL